ALLTVMISCKKADPGSQAASSNDSIILANDIYQRATRYKGSGNDSLRWYASRLIRLGEAQGNDRVIVNGLRLKANYEWRTANHTKAMKVAVEALQMAEKNK